uniref:Uncharacterized protein n=1 Tax=Physcomitrium patens TaxID=3218 RepID=A0A2K1JN22_PHYPA|nr:hypothetical protein PHYPA_017771 [Physcomitrium patens]
MDVKIAFLNSILAELFMIQLERK